MAEVLRSFAEPFHHAEGDFHARVVGRAAADGMWEGWLEFVPLWPDGGNVVVSAVESRQPAKEHLDYWAQGLTAVYVEGALDRALHPITVRTRIAERPASTRPAARMVKVPVQPYGPEPVLDPVEIGSRSLDILRQGLHALDRARLLNIITAYDLNPANTDLTSMTEAELIGFVVVAVESRLVRGRP